MKLFSPASFLDPSLAMREIEAALNKTWAAIYNFQAGELPEAPADGVLYGRQNVAWSAVPSAAGADGQVQYNAAGAFSGAANLTVANGNPNVTAGNSYLYDGADVIHGDPANNNFYFGKAGSTSNAGSENTAIGQSALSANTTHSYNTAVGSLALPYADGDWNTCIGRSAGYNITTGSSNTVVGAVGGFAAMSNTLLLAAGHTTMLWADNNNIVIGYQSGPQLLGQTGVDNAFMGVASGYNLTTGNGNIGIGSYAGYNLANGSNNTLIGWHAGQNLVSGSNNTIIGSYYQDISTLSNQVILADGSNHLAVQYDCPNKTWQMPTTTVGALPAAGVVGRRAFVTDANASTFYTVAAGGGSIKVPVFDDGANWRIG